MSSVFTRSPAAEDRGAAARRDPIVVHMVVRVLALSGLAATLHMQLTSGQEVHGCQPGDPKGYFTGTATSQQSGALEVSLNLRCAEGRYNGELVTPLGTFAVTGGRANSSHLHLLFTAGPDVGTLDATLSADTVRGGFAVSGDSGVIALRRVGETRPDGWDTPTLDLDAARWRQDLAFFAHEIVARHSNAFHSLPRHRFDSLVTGLDLTSAREVGTLTLADDAGHHFSFEAHAVPMNVADASPWTHVFTSRPLYLQHPDQAFWHQYLPEARTVYCSFRGYDSLSTRAADLLALVERTRPDKLVIDMRQNGGGDYTLGLRYLVEPISRLSHLNRRGHLFVAIGTNTFSAGMANAAQFRTRTAAVLVGQMIGEKPNSFQEAREMRLPNSHLRVRYSTQYYHFVVQGPNAVRPDHAIAPTWADYRGGRDSVLEWILRSGAHQ